jgi:hypothetical protein
MGLSQHKETTRICLGCDLEKTFPARNETCSSECADRLRLARAGKSTEDESQEKTDTTWTISIPKSTIDNVDKLLEQCKVDTSVWKVVKTVINKWDMATVPRTVGNDKDGWSRKSTKPIVTQLFQVKIFLERNVQKEATLQEIADLKADFKLSAARRSLAPAPKQHNSGIMLEIGIPDLHMGKLAWAKETGYQNYDSQIAADLFAESVEALVERTSHHNIEKICFVVGNDLLNTDNLQNTTTRGTPQHNDVRFQRTYRATRRMIADAITRLSAVAPVKAIVVPGNHDSLSTWCLGDSLECYFHNQKHVVIQNDPTPRKYFQWGKVMLMWTHGDKGKHDKYPLLMATEQREMFGATTWREIHVGHLHQVQLRELNGVRVRILPSLAAADSWHSEMAYVGNIRSAEAYVWHREEGLLGTATFAAPDYDYREIARAA